MNIENIKRASKIESEIRDLNNAIDNTEKLIAKNTGFIITEHSDFSGVVVDTFYKDGNYPKIYKTIAEDMLLRLQSYKKELLKEIETL